MRTGIGLRQGGQDHAPALEEFGEGCGHPALLGAGDGMSGHQIRRHLAESGTGGLHHAPLGAADIGQYGLIGQGRCDGAKHSALLR